jgi:hypothetical protein
VMRMIAVAVLLGVAAMPARADPPPCQAGIDEVERMKAETPLPPAKEAQVRALLEQVVRACRENNDVVVQAGLEQVKAILEEQKKASP